MSEWKEYKLSDLMEIIGGGTPKTTIHDYWGGDIPWLSVVDFGNSNKIVYDTEKKITNKGLNNSSTKLLKKGQLIISARGTVGELSILGRNMAFNQSCYGLNANSNICSNNFLYYLLKCKISELKTNAHGAVFDTITRNTFESVSAFVPDLPTQTAIAEILSSLDDKIELNNQINKDLEALAQALFKQWFIDFQFPNENGEPYRSSGGEMVDSELGEIPKGWKVVSLKELLNNVKKTTKAGVHLSDRKYVPIDELPMKSLTANSFREYSEAVSSLLLFEKFDILIGAMRVYFHRVCIAPFKGVTRSTCFVLRPKNPIDLAFALLLLNRDETISFASATSKGSTMPYAVWENGLADFTVAYPNSVLSNEFNELLFPIFKNLINNSKENIELTNLRNTLLPKLISGELVVSDIQTKTL